MEVVVALTAILLLLSTITGIWLAPLYRKLSLNEQAIRVLENEVDGTPGRIDANMLVSVADDNYRQGLIDEENRLLRRKIERLKQERQFIIDKLPFFKK